MKLLLKLISFTLFLFFTSCTNLANQQPIAIPVKLEQTNKALHQGYQHYSLEGRRNEVLNLLEIGLDAFQIQAYKDAETAFDMAIDNIESIYGDNEAAQAARKLWYAEDVKDFKGEPYERVMAYYYRGLLYLKKGDLDNANACFKAGALQDAFKEEDQEISDFFMLTYYRLWISDLLNEDSISQDIRHFFKNILKSKMSLPKDGDNILIVAEGGNAPRKLADGIGHHTLVYRKGKAKAPYKIEVIINDTVKKDLTRIEDIFYQANSRGARPIDRIIEGKVKFKENTKNIGKPLSSIGEYGMMASVLLSNSKSSTPLAIASGSLAVVGSTFQFLSLKTTVKADTRNWRNLPEFVHTTTIKLPAGSHKLKFNYYDQAGNLIGSSSKSVNVEPKNPTLIYSRQKNNLISSKKRKKI
ncbi:MAG: hypothetical protein MK132_27465 [Lentisphaerales bacterium]|nr:hypothetical protein [Lentisphaerales bacterium]